MAGRIWSPGYSLETPALISFQQLDNIAILLWQPESYGTVGFGEFLGCELTFSTSCFLSSTDLR